jgi:vacuolar protein-sorting-associated protein 4
LETTDWLHIQRAIGIVNGAIEEDIKQNYAEAFKQYQFSLDYFVLALKCTSTSFTSPFICR